MAPPSLVVTLHRLKPDATRCSSVGSGSRPPAICSTANVSNGRFWLYASITHSRYFHMTRRLSRYSPWVSA